MTRVSHAITDVDSAGNPLVRAKSYSAAFSADSMEFQTRGVEAEAGVRIRTTEIRAGANRIPLDGAGSDWLIVGNTAQRLIASAGRIIEHCEARREGVEMTWVIEEKPTTAGDLEISVEVDGLAHAGETEKGMHFADEEGISRVRFGTTIFVDAAGKRVQLATEQDRKLVRIRVPGNLLEAAEYPVAIDPLISAEFGMDQPVISLAAHDQDAPRVASNGEDFLVVWHDKRNGADFDVIGTRVTRNGVVLDTEGLKIGVGARDQQYPAVAGNGNGYLVTWVETNAGPFGIASGIIRGGRVSAAGEILDGNGFDISADPAGVTPAVASDGTNYLVSWTRSWNFPNEFIELAPVSAAGIVGGLQTLPGGNVALAKLASNSKSYYLVWQEGTSASIKGRRLNSDGAPLDSSTLTVSGSVTNAYEPGICSDGTNFFVVWQSSYTDNYNIYGARISANGALLDSNPLLVGAGANTVNQTKPVVASVQGEFLVAWQARVGDSSGARGRLVDGNGQVLGANPFPLSEAAPADFYPEDAIASNGSEYLVVWSKKDWDNKNIHGSIVSRDGVATGSGGFAVSLGRNDEEFPKVASNGQNYLVVWEDSRDPSGTTDIYGARLDRNGGILDPNGIAIARAVDRQFRPAVASNGTNYLTAWLDDRIGVTHVFATAITGAGAVLSPGGIDMDALGNAAQSCSIASNGDAYLVAWEESTAVRGRALSGSGEFTGNATTYSGSMRASAPSAASSGNGYLVAWSGTLVSDKDIFGLRINAAGIPQGTPFTIAQAVGDQINPTLASDESGDSFLAWQDLRSGRNWEIYGTRVRADGPENSGQLLVTDAQFPALASNGAGYALGWQTLRTDALNGIEAMRLNTAGFAETAVIPISESIPGQGYPSVSAISENILVVYQKQDETTSRRVFGKIISQWSASLWTGSDVGAVSSPGAVDFGSPFISVRGSGTGIGGSRDVFYFVSQPLEGDGQITARVLSLEPQLAMAQGGVMIREGLSADAPFAFMGYSRTAQGALSAVFDWRGSAGSNSFETKAQGAAWMRLMRVGSAVIGFQSDDGAAWTVVGFATIPFGVSPKIGLASSGNVNGGGVTATFDRVSVDGLLFPQSVGMPPSLYASREAGLPLRILVMGEPKNYEIEATTDFAGWTTIGNASVSSIAAIFTDPDSMIGSTRFYRARMASAQ